MTDEVAQIGSCARCRRSCEPDVEGLCPDCQDLARRLVDELNAGQARIVGNLADFLRQSRKEREADPDKWMWLLFPAMNAWLLYVEPIDYGPVVLLVNVLAVVVLSLFRHIERTDEKTIAEGDELRRRYAHLLAKQEGETP